MTRSEIESRGFSLNENLKVLDNFGNEYRNEGGSIEYLESDYESFGLHLQELVNIGASYSVTDLIGLAIRYDTPIDSEELDRTLIQFDNDIDMNVRARLKVIEKWKVNEF